MLTDPTANALASAFMAQEDPPAREGSRGRRQADPQRTTASARGACRSRAGYFEVYNRTNVRLVDLNETPIERITPAGLRTSAEDFEFDMLIYATGFDGVTGPYDRIDIRGPGGRRLKDDWDGMPRTFLGMLADGLSQHADGAGPAYRARQHSAQHRGDRRLADRPGRATCARAACAASRRGPRRSADWVAHVEAAVEGLLFSQVNSWQTGVNRNVEGRQVRRVLGYYGGAVEYRRIIEDVAAKEYRAFSFR